jgi:hypothetical protein
LGLFTKAFGHPERIIVNNLSRTGKLFRESAISGTEKMSSFFVSVSLSYPGRPGLVGERNWIQTRQSLNIETTL